MAAGAQIGLDHLVVLLYFGGRAFSNLLAVVQHRDAVAQAHNQFHIVLNEQNRSVVVTDAVDQLAQHHFLRRVHARSRFVERDELRVGGQSAGNFQAPLVAVTQGAGLVVGKFGYAHIVQQLARARGNGSFFGLEGPRAEHGAQQAGVGADVAPDHHVFQRSHFGKQANVLKGSRDARLCHGVHRRGLVGLTRQGKRAAVGRVQTGQDVKEGRFSSAVGADQAVNLAALDLDAHIAERLQSAKTLGYAGYIEDGVFGFWICGVSHGRSNQALAAGGSDLPCSGVGHRPRGRISITVTIAKAMSSWRRMDASNRPPVMFCNGPAT